MSRSRILSSIAAAAIGVTLLGACSVESVTERAAGFGLEQAIEGNEDIDLDLGGDGGFTINTEDGELTINLDGENAGIFFDSEEGEGSISFDATDLEELEDIGRANLNGEDVEVERLEDHEDLADLDIPVLEGVDGLEGLEDLDFGDIDFEDLDFEGFDFEDFGIDIGEIAEGGGFFGSNEVPENWPGAIGYPRSGGPDQTFYTSIDMGIGSVITGIFEHADGDDFDTHVKGIFETMGWTKGFETSDGGSTITQYMNGETSALIAADGGSTSVTITTFAA